MWMNEGRVDGKPFISEGTFNTLTSINLATRGQGAGAALGWFVEEDHGEKIITHSGGMPGFILNHAVVPGKDLAVIALGNGESYSVFAITEKILDLYLGDGAADPAAGMLQYTAAARAKDAERRNARLNARIKGTKPTATASALKGTYIDKVYGEAVIDDANGTPTLSFTHAKDLFSGPLAHWHYDTWTWAHSDPFLEAGHITFEFDTDHKVTGFRIDLNSPDFHFHKLHFQRH